MIQGQHLFADHICIQAKTASSQVVELFIYFPNIYDLFFQL